MAGSSTTSPTKAPKTSPPTISVEPVSPNPPTIQPPPQRARNNSPHLVPKFQGENFYNNKRIVEEIKKLASAKGCTLTQIALAWVAAQGMIAIPGTTKPSRLEENWTSREIELTESEKAEMRKIVDAAKPVGNRYSERAQAMVGH